MDETIAAKPGAWIAPPVDENWVARFELERSVRGGANGAVADHGCFQKGAVEPQTGQKVGRLFFVFAEVRLQGQQHATNWRVRESSAETAMMSDDLVRNLASFGPVTEDRVEEFEELVADLSSGHPRSSLQPLILALDDACEFDEVMFGVVHCLEGFPLEVYFEELAACLPDLRARAPRWCSVLHTRIMNSPAAFQGYLATVEASAYVNRDAGVKIFQGLQAKPQFYDRCVGTIERLIGANDGQR